MRKRRRFVSVVLLAMGLLAGSAAALAQEATQPPEAPADLYARLVDEYMKGKWDDLEKDLAPRNKNLNTLSRDQKLDVTYMRETVAECRPLWWRQVKANQAFNFQPAVWGRTMRASFDPDQKTNININYVNGQATVTFKWDVADMDSPAEAEHGFTKGELADLGVWGLIGEAQSWALVPLQSQLNLTDAGKLQLQRYLEFNADVAGAYYGKPRARRWGLWLACAYYLNKYANMPTVNSRKALGSMFLAEVVAHRAKYPSIELPPMPDDKIEENLCIGVKNYIEKHAWTLAEDKSLREALKAFVLFNQNGLMQSGVVRMPNGLAFALDPSADQSNQESRDLWLKRNLHE